MTPPEPLASGRRRSSGVSSWGNANRHGWIILDDDRPVGYFDAEQDDGTVYIAALIFARDRASGLGRTVLRTALATPPLTEASNVIGCVEVDNTPARRLLRRAGFVEDGLDHDGLMLYRYTFDSPHERAGPPGRGTTRSCTSAASASPSAAHSTCGSTGPVFSVWSQQRDLIFDNCIALHIEGTATSTAAANA